MILLALAMLLTLFALGGGLISLWQGDEAQAKQSGRMMQLRVAAQGIAIFLMLLIALVRGAS